jgi:predicted nucleotidyltransferase component of viral defense system
MSNGSAESIRQRLLNLAKERGEDFDYVLRQYVIQRLLYRLCKSDYSERFLLKGAQLFWVWNKAFHRPTRDVDLLGFGAHDVNTWVTTFQDVCGNDIEDGLVFDSNGIQGIEIKEDAMYQGVRISGFAELARARIPFQIDIGFGDVVSPEPVLMEMPVFLDMPVPEIRGYSVYTVIAEKFQAMVYLGLANSRMKDFYDVWYLASCMNLDGETLANAIKATFLRRETPVTDEALYIFSEKFAGNTGKGTQWNAFLKKNRLNMDLKFEELIRMLQTLIEPVYQSLGQNLFFNQKWSATDWRRENE